MNKFTIWNLKCGLFFLCFTLSHYAQSKSEETFSIRLKQAPLANTVQQIATLQNVNLVIDDELQGSISLQLQDTNLTQLLQSIAKIKQLTLWQENNIYYLSKTPQITPKNQTISLNTNELAEPFTTSNTTPLSTLSIKLYYAKASDVMKSLTSGNGSLLSPSGSISFDERNNLLIIQDEQASLAQIKRLVAEMDKPIEQIAIEARIVTISAESLKELGIRWGLFNSSGTSHKVSGSLNSNNFSNITDNLHVNFATNATPTGSVALQIAKINGRLLDLELTALERENSLEIIASPRLLTTNKKSASIKQGTEIPYVINNRKNDTQSIEFREAVLGLEVMPHLSKDGGILLDLLVSQNAPGGSISYGENEVVSINKQEISTQVFAQDGETIVLGGIFHNTIIKGTDKVPVLGDIPVIKRLFSKEIERHQKRELVIFVTPYLVKKEEKFPKMDLHKNSIKK